jgi:exodeoxyribonuclease VIII
MTIPKITNSLTAEEYHATAGISKTQLGYLKKSPAHLRAYLDAPKSKPTEDQIIGTAVHVSALERDLFDEQYVLAPVVDRRTTAGKATYAQFVADNAGKIALDASDYVAVQKIGDSIRSTKSLAKFGITPDGLRGISEASVFSVDVITNLVIKARLDYYDEETNTIIDVKTCRDASFHQFRRDIYKYSYGLQSVHYRKIVEDITGRPCRFIFAAVEKEEPYAVQLFELDSESSIAIENERRHLLDSWNKAIKTNVFESYPQEVAIVSL